MTLFTLVERLLKPAKAMASAQERQNGCNPLHVAFASGNLEIALWIMAVLQNVHGADALADVLN